MKCPHCLDSFHPQPKEVKLGEDSNQIWGLSWQACPNCKKFVIELAYLLSDGSIMPEFLVYPKTVSRLSLSPDVPEEYAGDYKEACLVVTDSPKASAALSRRCLQNILRDNAGIKPQDLSKEIDEVISSRALPSHLSDAVDAVRNIGNFAAHPMKSKSTGEIVNVEPGEAEWLLDVLEGLFDFYFVQPGKLQKKKDALNQKLADAGKPPMK